MSEARWYEVLTPEYGDRIVICDDGTGPMEYGRDWAAVRAASKRQAVATCVQAWLRGENPDESSPDGWSIYGRTYCQRQRDDGCSPWTGIRAELFACEHGVAFDPDAVDEDGSFCDECRDAVANAVPDTTEGENTE